MPNHVTQRLKLKGTKKDLQAIADLVTTHTREESNAFDHNKILPMPAALRNTESASGGTEEEVAYRKALYADNMKKYGFSNWYDWANEVWGTKWGCYDCSRVDNTEYTFNSAWGPATNIIVELSAKFPKVEMELSYADEGGGFIGICSIWRGEVQSEDELDWLSEGAAALRIILYGYDCESEKEEVDVLADEADPVVSNGVNNTQT